MGYNTQFSGELKFTAPMNSEHLRKIDSFLGEDCRDHPEWGADDLTYIDLGLSKEGTGLMWDGSEKTYDLVEKVNLIIRKMQEDYPEFGLSGSLLAQGEDMEDRWLLVIEDGVAIHKEAKSVTKDLQCPHCGRLIEI